MSLGKSRQHVAFVKQNRRLYGSIDRILHPRYLQESAAFSYGISIQLVDPFGKSGSEFQCIQDLLTGRFHKRQTVLERCYIEQVAVHDLSGQNVASDAAAVHERYITFHRISDRIRKEIPNRRLS